MKHIKKYNDFKLNEELLSTVMNYFKGVWNNAMNDLKKYGAEPTTEQIDTFIENNLFNKTGKEYLFKKVMDDFKALPSANNEACLELVDSVLIDVLGDDNLNPLYDSLLKNYGKNLVPMETIKFYLQTARKRAIKDYKYIVGGKNNNLIDDLNHLPDLKKILKPITDDKVRKDSTYKWVNDTLIVRLLKYIQEIKKEDLDKYLASKNLDEKETGLKVGDTVKWTSKQGDVVEYVISSIDGDSLSFDGVDWHKKINEVEKVEVDLDKEKNELTNKLKELSKTPEKIKQLDSFADFISREENADKITEIEKIMKQ